MIAYVAVTTVDNPTDATRWTAVAFIILYEIVFAFGWLGTCWIYGPEISPLKYRHVAGALGASGEWFSTWIMVFGGGTGIDAVGPKIFIWPLICCFLAAAYVYFCCPETTGKTLEEVIDDFVLLMSEESLIRHRSIHYLRGRRRLGTEYRWSKPTDVRLEPHSLIPSRKMLAHQNLWRKLSLRIPKVGWQILRVLTKTRKFCAELQVLW